MGMMGKVLGLGRVLGGARDVAEVFVPNRTALAAQGHEAYLASLAQYEGEFAAATRGWFDAAVDGLNRLPRPLIAFGTMGLFAYAMADPTGFTKRMQGLAYVPEPLWWLLGAIVGFYFGARELHYVRKRAGARQAVPSAAPLRADPLFAPEAQKPANRGAEPKVKPARRPADPDWNAALEEWQALRARA